ncbi:SOS response-associated peptidase [Chitinilyticum aquatile]|uniref:SOS response-associated peptidase n=1 Tax=Chitinilyticum aquatile TaxID=362520 RepID=UPI00041384C0|nr:SOS response-associated peptidase family protein [Chitinilyticum aquatile]
MLERFHAAPPAEDWREEVWQDYAAPILIGGDLAQQCVLANYGFLPKRHLPPGTRYSTMNARAETIGELRSYKGAWQRNQLCLVPMLGFFEPCYETGKAVRHLIQREDGEPFAVAGLWRTWEEEGGLLSYSFTQITINADRHPLLSRMHKPGDEKRSLVVIPERDYDNWLDCQNIDIARAMLGFVENVILVCAAVPQKQKTAEEGGLFDTDLA